MGGGSTDALMHVRQLIPALPYNGIQQAEVVTFISVSNNTHAGNHVCA